MYEENYKEDVMIKKLKTIFNYYKKKYKLNTTLTFSEIGGCSFNTNFNNIHYNLYFHSILNATKLTEKIIICLSGSNEFKTTKKGALIWELLHEIKHAMDYTYCNKKWDKEINKINFEIYYCNANYHNKLPFEKRANKFAKQELKKWI